MANSGDIVLSPLEGLRRDFTNRHLNVPSLMPQTVTHQFSDRAEGSLALPLALMRLKVCIMVTDVPPTTPLEIFKDLEVWRSERTSNKLGDNSCKFFFLCVLFSAWRESEERRFLPVPSLLLLQVPVLRALAQQWRQLRRQSGVPLCKVCAVDVYIAESKIIVNLF